MSKKKLRSKANFHHECVQYIKKRRGGYILPRDTSYVRIVQILESYTGVVNGDGNSNLIARAKLAAEKLGIPVPSSIGKQNDYSRSEKLDFYASLAWKKLRYATLVRFGARCQCCGASGKDVKIQVDHIKPVSKFWKLRLNPTNVQVLCGDCNWGKLNLDQTDWR